MFYFNTRMKSHPSVDLTQKSWLCIKVNDIFSWAYMHHFLDLEWINAQMRSTSIMIRYTDKTKIDFSP